MKIRLLHNAGTKEREAFKYHLIFSSIDGMIRGALVLNEFVFVKSLYGSAYQLSVLFQSSLVVLLLSLVFNELIIRTLNKKKMLRKAGALTHIPMLALLFFPSDPEVYLTNPLYHYIFLFIFFSYYLSYPVILPTVNLFLKNVYTGYNFGRLYGISTSVRQIFHMLLVFMFGLLLDMDNYAFTYVMPILGLLGIFSIFMFSRIGFNQELTTETSGGIISSVAGSIKKMVRILKTNKAYFDYQMAFMLYGFTFMSTKSVIILYYYESLKLSYSSVAFYQNVYNVVAIALLPFFGKIIGKTDPRKFSVIPFMAMGGYILFVLLTGVFSLHMEIWNLTLYVSLLISSFYFGLFTSTITLSWNIGSSYFCRNEEAGDYQSIHLFLTGIRGLFSPIIGIVLYKLFGFACAFIVGILALLGASLYMGWSYKNRKIGL